MAETVPARQDVGTGAAPLLLERPKVRDIYVANIAILCRVNEVRSALNPDQEVLLRGT